jgi:flagellar hook-basal body complex protein FliE
MTNPIQIPGAIQPIGPPMAGAPNAPQTDAASGKDFKTILLESLDEVNRLQKEADQGVQQLVTGESDNVVEVLAAVNKAGVAFDLLMEIRNKMTDAYRDIQQMRV